MFPNQVVVESWIPLQAGPILFAALIIFKLLKTKRVHADKQIIKHQKLCTQCKLHLRLPAVFLAGSFRQLVYPPCFRAFSSAIILAEPLGGSAWLGRTFQKIK
jgi:hypothetical protein